MVKGIGIDLVEIARIGRAIGREHFLNRVYTPAERELIGGDKLPVQRAAGNYAAKEALGKALGCGISGCPLDAVEVLRSETGAPVITTYGKAKERMDALGVRHIWVSITHDGGMAVAVVVLEGD